MQLIVLGMHRSGTSVLARLLNLMGAYFGPEGMSTGANQENPRGFWERRDVRELNDMVLHSAGCDWNRVAALDLGAVPADVAADFRKRAADILLRMDAYRPWMLKEPRLMLLLPLWRELLQAPVCIQIFRNPVEVASSLQTRNRIPMEVGLALWEFYVRRGVAASEGLPRITVSHRQLVSEPSATVAALLEQLQSFGVSGLRMPAANEIGAFVVDELYREREGRSDLRSYMKAPQVKLFRELEAGLPSSAGTIMSKVGMQRLREYEAGLPPLQPRPKAVPPQPDVKMAEAVTQLLAELRRREAQFEKFEKQLAEERAKSQTLVGEIEREREARASAQDAARAARQATDDELRDAREKHRQLAEDVSARNRRIDELEQQWKATGKQRDGLAADLQLLQQRIAQADARIAALLGSDQRQKADLETARAELASLLASSAGTKKALAAEEQRRSAVEESLEFRVEEIVRLTRALMDRDQRVSLLSKGLEAANEGEAKALDDLAEWRAVADVEMARAALLQADLEATIRALIQIRGSRSWRAVSLLRSTWSLLASRRSAGPPPPLSARSLLRGSGLFDAEWYVAHYPDVASSEMDPLDHYLSFGAAEGRNPSGTFDTNAYLAGHPGLAASGVNPLLHYLLDDASQERA